MRNRTYWWLKHVFIYLPLGIQPAFHSRAGKDSG